jgi:3',5'-nucleoside bisphosphate phosphatase
MIKYRAELHVHTVLSPCAEVEMIPPLIIQSALDMEINLLAITDHNSTANIPAMMDAAVNSGITILPGMELQTREEVHLLCIFDKPRQAFALQQLINPLLPPINNDPEHFGEQFVVDATGDFIKTEPRLLLASVNLGLDDAVLEVHKLGGLAVPAHVDRKAYGLINMLGFFPPDAQFDAVEISRFTSPEKISLLHPGIKRFPIIQNGDVHRLNEFMGSCCFEMESSSVGEMIKAFKGIRSRYFSLVQTS